jgi:hypothetical protein
MASSSSQTNSKQGVGSARSPIEIVEDNAKAEKAPVPQVPNFDDATLKEMASLLAQVCGLDHYGLLRRAKSG